jgi:hypothetical protein
MHCSSSAGKNGISEHMLSFSKREKEKLYHFKGTVICMAK